MNMNRTKNITLKDIAKKLGISSTAVSYGLNNTDRLSSEMREKILATAKDMGYFPNAAARVLVTKKSYLIGVFVPLLNDSFFNKIVNGIDIAIRDTNYSILLTNLPADLKDCEKSLLRMYERKIDGLILFPSPQLAMLGELIKSHNTPVVQLLHSEAELGDNKIVVDNFGASYNAVSYLKKLGHKKIAMLHHGRELSAIANRYYGFESSAKDNAVEFDDNNFFAQLDFDDAYVKTKNYLQAHSEVDALFVASDLAALGATKAALELNKAVGKDFSIIGFDDLDIAKRQVLYPLTTVAQPKEQLGEVAGKMMLQLLKNETTKNVSLTAPLVVRETTIKRKEQ